ncbi:MAG: tetraacyldisaccharide 4'-kinase [Gemmataceae bacterium]|nr:tetraacyldisaccharide 4'-kinase [Gemmataceae bacterium]
MASFARGGLWLASLAYGLGTRWRDRTFTRHPGFRPPVPVISIGNLTVGGTGKTPTVELIARSLRDRGIRPVILSRGYGSESGPNDEALVLEDNLPDVPHLQSPDRVAIAQTAVEELEAEALILDDGFQHRKLARDLDIVLIDATNPWGYGHLLPRGLLREPVSALGRAGAVIITRSAQADAATLSTITARVRKYCAGPLIEANHIPLQWHRESGETAVPEAFAGQRVAAFCGLGNPESFRQTLADLKTDVIAWRTYPDHHNYTRADVDDLRTWAQALPADTPVLTTQKDVVKLRLRDLAGHALWSLRIGLQLRDGPATTQLHELLGRLIPTVDA